MILTAKHFKTVYPNKFVSSSANTAIKDLIEAKKLIDIGEMAANFLYTAFKDCEDLTQPIELPYMEATHHFHAGMKEQMFKKLDLKFVYINSYYEEMELMYTGIRAIEMIRARIETRRHLKMGCDMFPSTARVPEFDCFNSLKK